MMDVSYSDPRNYSNYGNKLVCAADIVRECMFRGRSDGWRGTKEDLEKVKAICNKFGVEYVDDSHGTWKPKAAK